MEQDQVNESVSEAANGTKIEEPSLGKKLLGKLIKWIFYAVVIFFGYKFFSGMADEQKQNFMSQAKGQVTISCKGDKACIEKANKYFNECINGNYSSYRSGKYKRRYVLNEEGFNQCIANK